MTIAAKISKPPIVGVPSFSFCPSRFKSRTVSPICFLRSHFMKGLPNTSIIISDVITDIAARNEMYWNTPAPGKLKALSNQLNR